MVNVPISGAVNRGNRMNKRLDVCVRKDLGCLPVEDRGILSDSVAIAHRHASVLVNEMNEIAIAEVAQESFGISPACGHGRAVTVAGHQVNSMELRGGNDMATQKAQVSRKAKATGIRGR